APQAFISVDPHLPVTPATLDRWREVLAGADAFFPSDDEWRLDTADPASMFGALAGGRLRFVAWKRGAGGGALHDLREKQTLAWAPPPRPAVDPTGAGDAFAAGFITAHLAGEGVESALRRGVVTAGAACAGVGTDGLLATTPAMLRSRLAEQPV